MSRPSRGAARRRPTWRTARCSASRHFLPPWRCSKNWDRRTATNASAVEPIRRIGRITKRTKARKHEMNRFSCYRVFVFSWLLAGAVVLAAPDHTLVVLSHSNHTVYELDPASGRVLHEFVAPDQPHEAAVTADGATIFASVPAASF